MKFLFQNNRIGINVTRFPVMLKIFLYHLIGYITCTPSTITYSPEVTTPVSFRQLWIFLLQSTRCPSFQTLNYITYVQRRAIFYMDVNVIFANNSFQNFYILRVTNLFYQLAATSLNIPLQNFIPILCNQNYMSCKPRYRVTSQYAVPYSLSKVRELGSN